MHLDHETYSTPVVLCAGDSFIRDWRVSELLNVGGITVPPHLELIGLITIMSPRKRQLLAWLLPILAIVVLCAAWAVRVAPFKSTQPAKPLQTKSLQLLSLRAKQPITASVPVPANNAAELHAETPMLDWSPPLEPIRRLKVTPKVAGDNGQLLADNSRPTVRAQQISTPKREISVLRTRLAKPSNSTINTDSDDSVLNRPLRNRTNEQGHRENVTPDETLPTDNDKPLRRLNVQSKTGESVEPQESKKIEPLDCWWQSEVPTALRPSDKKWTIQLDDLLVMALQHSDLVQSMRLEPLIQQTEIAVATAAFDPAAFVESKWNDLNDPVGNTLTTGGPTRYKDKNVENSAGIRQKNRLGGRVEAAQELNLRDTNSVFFIPKNQANTRMVLSYTQPLLRGGGRCYNEGFIVLAQIDTDIARRQLQQRLQDHLLDVADAYWTLYLERARYVQQLHALERTVSIQEELEARAEIDVVRSQILRARGSVAQRRAAVKRAEVGVRNQEAVVWSLTNAPDLVNRKTTEILPTNGPDCRPLPITSEGSVVEALNRRPEVAVVFEKIHAAQTRLGIAEHELLPTLNLVMQTYVHGLTGDYDVGSSLSRQFDTGAPSYSVGLSFLMPYGNAAAKANLTKRQLEMSQLAHELNATLKRVTVEVENALRDVDAAQASIAGNKESLDAAAAELDYLLDRWRMLPGEDRLASLLLDEALGALDRLVAAESAYAQSQVDYALSITRYKRAAGMLLQTYPVTPDRQAVTPSRLSEPEPVPPPAPGRTARNPSRAMR